MYLIGVKLLQIKSIRYSKAVHDDILQESRALIVKENESSKQPLLNSKPNHPRNNETPISPKQIPPLTFSFILHQEIFNEIDVKVF